ncbi:hypothetical protein HPB51_014495 [Rhipicephalus microplus]|uniref:Uncharacterized protein n=1 Tax=Rhipicephalus microplus TaxID=6941 RepID=A0A9J6EHJ0_RHIMP|nr:hypothetical protein HPB51_014495 [Rhipicephalus microplus]
MTERFARGSGRPLVTKQKSMDDVLSELQGNAMFLSVTHALLEEYSGLKLAPRSDEETTPLTALHFDPAHIRKCGSCARNCLRPRNVPLARRALGTAWPAGPREAARAKALARTRPNSSARSSITSTSFFHPVRRALNGRSSLVQELGACEGDMIVGMDVQLRPLASSLLFAVVRGSWHTPPSGGDAANVVRHDALRGSAVSRPWDARPVIAVVALKRHGAPPRQRANYGAARQLLPRR